MKHVLTTAGLLALVAVGASALAFSSSDNGDRKTSVSDAAPRSLEWTDLAPPLSPEAKRAAAELNLRIDQMTDQEIEEAMAKIESEGNVLVEELDDTEGSLVGFLVPLDFNAERSTEFVLVPYFGACIHVPPPPPNQIVYVKYPKGLVLSETEMYAPFHVKGRIKAAYAQTDLAPVGYQMTASGIEVSKEQ